jgi:hypothetical protein
LVGQKAEYSGVSRACGEELKKKIQYQVRGTVPEKNTKKH